MLVKDPTAHQLYEINKLFKVCELPAFFIFPVFSMSDKRI
jgi:hypothetical protein